MNYIHFVELPLKLVACWQWFSNPKNLKETIVNYLYLAIVIFFLGKSSVGLLLHLYREWIDIMSSLHEIADSLPLLVSQIIVCYYFVYRKEFYELVGYMREHFKHHSAQGLTNMTMSRSYETAKSFAKVYTICTMFSVTMYCTMPVGVHWWTKEPIQGWIYSGVTGKEHYVLIFFQLLITQWFVGLAMGQFGVFFAANSILICGQLDLLCCSLRNVRYTALLQRGAAHARVAAAHTDIQLDERHGFIYNRPEMVESDHHYDGSAIKDMDEVLSFDIYDKTYDEPTMSAIRECAVMCQAVMEYKGKFERFVSPLLAVRVIQVTLYLCTLLYAATLNFDMTTAEYLVAVCLDIFVYCYYGNQIILQADRVSTAAYQSAWHTLGVRPRKALLNLLLANRRPVVMRAGRFLPMDLHTFVVIIKTSFSYYTLLVNVNEK